MKLSFDIVLWGLELGLVTLSLSLSYALVGYANFALVELCEVGAFLAIAINHQLPLPAAAAVAALACGALAVLLNQCVFQWLREANVAARMLVSIAVAMVIRSLVQLKWGAGAHFFDIDPRPLTTIAGVFVTRAQIAVVITAIVALVSFHLLVRRTGLGRILRATAESPSLVEVRGISSRRVIAGAWFLAGSLAGVGGVLFGMDTYVQPSMGQSLILPMFAAAVVGGMGSLYGAVAGAFLLSTFENVGVGVNFGHLFGVGSIEVGTQYKSALAIMALVLTLLVRPRGLLGKRS